MKILMLHDVRPYDPDFFPERYAQHSFLTDTEFMNGINKVRSNIVNPQALFHFSINHKVEDVVLTFDDGLKDHLWAAEFLAGMGLSAIFFIPFGVISEKIFINSHLIQFLVASGRQSEIEKYIHDFLSENGLTKDQINGYYISRWAKNVWSQQEIFITRTLREALNGNLRQQMINYLSSEYLPVDLDDLHDKFYLNFPEVEKIASLGHIIGSHGYFSLDLRFENDDTVHSELHKSFSYLSKYPAKNRIISYPNGGVSDNIKRVAEEIGYEFAFGTRHEAITATFDKMNISRLDGTKLGLFV
jgi:hypothetical protein